jgi:hypothetical protein
MTVCIYSDPNTPILFQFMHLNMKIIIEYEWGYMLNYSTLNSKMTGRILNGYNWASSNILPWNWSNFSKSIQVHKIPFQAFPGSIGRAITLV